MSDRRRFLKGLTSLPLATALASPRLAAAVSAGLQEVEAKLSDGRTVKAALAVPKGQANGSILLVHEWWGLAQERRRPQDMRFSNWVANPGTDTGIW